MATQNLEIIISSTVSDAVKGLDQVGKGSDKMAKDTERAAASVSKSFNQIDAAGKKLSASGKQVNAAAGSASITLTNLGRVASDLPFGFIAISNNLDPLIGSLSQVFSQSQTVVGGFKALGASLLGGAGIGLAFSITTALVTRAVQEYGSLQNAIDAFLRPLSEQEKLQKAVNDTIADGLKNGAQEVAKLETLYRATQNLNVPLSERNKIVDHLQKEYPSYFNNFSNEEFLAGKAASAYNNLKNAILQTATARAIEKKIAENAGKLIDLDLQRDELNRKAAKTQEEVAKSQANAAKTVALSQNQYGFSATAAGAAADGLASRVRGLTEDLVENRKEYARISDLNDELLKKSDGLAAALGADIIKGPDGDKSTEKKVKSIQSILDELNKDLLGLTSSFVSLGGKVSDLAEDKLKRLERAFRDLSDFGVRPGDEIFKQLDQQVKLLQNSLSRTPVTISIPKLNLQIPKAVSNTAANFKTLVDSFNFDGLRLELERGINDALQNLSLQGIQSIGDAIGSAIVGSGGGIQSAIKSFLTLLGGFFQQVGIQMITYSKVLQGLQIAIKSLNPYVAAIAGGLAIVAGGALKAYASNLPSFATGGGVVGGPTLAMIGDNPGREEYVIPSEVLDKMGGGGGYPERIELFLNGPNAVALLERGKRYTGRING